MPHQHTHTHTLACILVRNCGPSQIASTFSGQDLGDGDTWADSGRERGQVASPLPLGSQAVMSKPASALVQWEHGPTGVTLREEVL